jgi:4-amino-4-deoxy-L-arabinose transferase-like glycosyltransferase
MLASEAVGLVAAAMVAISPLAVYYSQEGRPYSLLILLITLVMAFFWEIVADRPRWWHWIGLTLATSLAFYTHQFAALVSIACGVYLLARFGIAAPRFRGWLLTQAIAALSCLPWVLFCIDLLRSGAGAAAFSKSRAGEWLWIPYTAFAYLFGFSLGPSLRELHLNHSASVIKPYLWWLVPMAAAGLWIGVVGLRQVLLPGRRPAGLLCLTWLLVPVALTLLTSRVTKMVYEVRYVSVSFPAFVLLFGVAALEVRRSLTTRIAWAVLAAGTAVSLANYYTNPRYFKEASREAAAFLAQHVASNDVVAATSLTAMRPLRFYGFDAPGDTYDFTPGIGGQDTDRVLASLERLKAGPARRIWSIEWRPWEGDPKGRMKQWLVRNATLLSERGWPEIEVREYQLEPKAPATITGAAPGAQHLDRQAVAGRARHVSKVAQMCRFISSLAKSRRAKTRRLQELRVRRRCFVTDTASRSRTL